jgi:hypothetical protein
MTNMQKFLHEHHASNDLKKWCRDNGIHFLNGWHLLQNGRWMLWIAWHLKVDKRLLVLAKARCAEEITYLMQGDSLKAVEVALLYGAGMATDEELEEARRLAEIEEVYIYHYTNDIKHLTDGTGDAAKAATLCATLDDETAFHTACCAAHVSMGYAASISGPGYEQRIEKTDRWLAGIVRDILSPFYET